jgi:hypothetical protein
MIFSTRPIVYSCPIPVGKAMAGRGGGGGGGGKGAAGRMMSLQEFVSSMAPLIDLEKVFFFSLSLSYFKFAVDSAGDRNG